MGIKEFTSFFVMENQHAKFLKVTISGQTRSTGFVIMVGDSWQSFNKYGQGASPAALMIFNDMPN